MSNELKIDTLKKVVLKSIADILGFSIFAVIAIVITYMRFGGYKGAMLIVILAIIYIFYYILTTQWIHGSIEKNNTKKAKDIKNVKNDINGSLIKHQETINNSMDKFKTYSTQTKKLKEFSKLTEETVNMISKKLASLLIFVQSEKTFSTTTKAKTNDLKSQLNSVSGLINELEDYSNQINSNLEIVDNINEQASMLALNITVEATRLGDQGKGFAVVANEIRKLSDESKQTTTKITSIIDDIKRTTETTSNTTNDTSKTLNSVVESYTNTIKNINAIDTEADIIFEKIRHLLKESAVEYSDDCECDIEKIHNNFNEFINSLKSNIEKLEVFANSVETND